MLTLKLKGYGVSPSISLSADNGVLDIGDALVGDTVSAILKVCIKVLLNVLIFIVSSPLCLDLSPFFFLHYHPPLFFMYNSLSFIIPSIHHSLTFITLFHSSYLLFITLLYPLLSFIHHYFHSSLSYIYYSLSFIISFIHHSRISITLSFIIIFHSALSFIHLSLSKRINRFSFAGEKHFWLVLRYWDAAWKSVAN